MQKWWFVVGALASVALSACGSEVGGPEAKMSDATTGQLTQSPFPSDAYRHDGKIDLGSLPLLSTDTVEGIRSALASLDGFPTTSSVFFPVSEPVTIAAGATADLVDLETQSAVSKWSLTYNTDYSHIVAIVPRGTSLLPGHPYAVVITDGVAAASGTLHPSSVMNEALAAHGRYAQLDSYKKLATYLKAKHLSPLAATAFTTHTRKNWYSEVAGDLDTTPPAIVIEKVYGEKDLDFLMGTNLANGKPGLQPGGGVVHDAIGWVILGHMTGPSFLPRPDMPDDAQAAIDGTLERRGDQTITWALVLPKKQSYAQTRLIHFQHGLGSNRSNVLAVANDPAARGYATFAIDCLFHGDRATTKEDKQINSTRADGVDGFADLGNNQPVLDFFAVSGDPSNYLPVADMRLMRDHFRQAAIDIMAAIRFEKHGDLSAIRALDPALADLSFDATKLGYIGESLGSILGAVVLAEDPELDAAVLDVGGGGLGLELITSSPNFAPMFGPLSALFIDANVDLTKQDPPPRSLLSLNLAQAAIELGDGVALATQLTDDKHAILLEAKWDEVVPNESSEALALAFGMKQLEVQGSEPTLNVTLPTAASPYMASPLRALVQIANSTHTQYSLQEDSSSFQPPWPPFTRRDQSLHVVHPIERVRGFALNFLDSYVAGTPTVAEPPLP